MEAQQDSSQQTQPQTKPVEGRPDDKLSQLADQAKGQAGENSFMNPGQKRARGRPKGSKTRENIMGAKDPMTGQPIPQVDPIAELMPLTHGLASFYSNFLVKLAEDERAKLTKEKSDLVAHTSAICLNQYFPGVLGVHASAIVLGVTILETSMTAIGLRNENLQKLREEAKRKRGEHPQPNGATTWPSQVANQ